MPESDVIQIGAPLVAGPLTTTYRRNVGGRTVLTFKGTPSAVQTKAIELVAAGYETEVSTGPYHTLTATANLDLVNNQEQAPIPVWGMSSHPLQTNIWSSDRTWIKGIPSSVKDQVEAKLKNPQKDIYFLPDDYPGGPFAPANQTLLANAARVFLYSRMGMEGRTVNALHLKRSIVVPNTYSLIWAVLNENNVLSTNRVISNADVPNNWAATMPSGGWSDEVVFVEGASAVDGMNVPWYYGWREEPAVFDSVGLDRTQVQQSWVFGRYTVGELDGMYDLVT